MPRHKQPSIIEQTEDAIRRAGSIGALERLAGIGTTPEARMAFWEPFCKLPGAESLDAGVAELKRIIRGKARLLPARETRSAARARHA
jgi:hypothetical protein